MVFSCCALCADEIEPVIRKGVHAFSDKCGRDVKLERFQKREDFLYRIRDGCCDAALVALPGAIGMETALNVRELKQTLPLVWITDDDGFALQSYRMQVKMFLRFPATEDDITEALIKCI